MAGVGVCADRRIGVPGVSSRAPRAGRGDIRRRPAGPPRRVASDAHGDLTPATVSAHSMRKAWWRCAACGHEWEASVGARVRSPRGGCRQCAQALVRRERHANGSSLAALHPELLAELAPARNPGIDPTELGARSGQTLWWRCTTCGHEWQTKVYQRTDGSGCPACRKVRRPWRADVRGRPARPARRVASDTQRGAGRRQAERALEP
jgi:predicted  nucleic acid-binding Zn-ribbon protein